MLSDEMKIRSNLLAALSSIKEAMAITTWSAAIADRKILNAIEIAVSRCTDRRDDDSPVDEKYVHEILFLVTNAPGSITFLSRRITARLEAAAGSPAVALKTLVLLHRLLRGGDRYFEQDLCKLCSSRELRIDLSSSGDTDQLHSFLFKYWLFLEERMGWIINQAGMLEPKAGPEAGSSQEDGAEYILYRLIKCQSFLDKIMDCLLNNMSSPSKVMQSACTIVLRESIRVYESFCDGMDVMLSSYPGFPKSLTASVLEIIKKASSQTPKLCSFYESCKRSSAGKSLDYPLVRIGMSSAQVSVMEQSDVHEDASCAQFSEKLKTTISTVWVEFEEQSSSRFISVGSS